MDILYQSVRRARHCIDEQGSLGYGWCDMKGGFQNVVQDDVLQNVVRDDVLEKLPQLGDTRGLPDGVQQL